MNTTTLFVIAKIVLKPDYFETCKGAVEGVLEITRAEVGCVQFELFQDVDNNTLFLYEEWVDEDALEFHHQQEYISSVFVNYSEWLSEPLEVNKLAKI